MVHPQGSRASEHNNDSFGAALRDLLEGARASLSAELAGEEVIEGELLRATPAQAKWWMTLLDLRSGEGIEAFAPSDGEPRRGNVLRLRGQYKVKRLPSEPVVKVQFEADELKDLGTSPRQLIRDRRVAELKRSFAERPLESLPRRILVLAPSTTLKDFKEGLGENEFLEFIEHRPCRFEGTAADIAGAIDNAAREKPDLLVIVRGGGSAIALDRFNEICVVEAMCSFSA